MQCDVSSTEAVDNLAATAKEKLGLVHYWINNAGINGGRRAFSELSYGTIEAVVKVNLLGSLLCTQAAMKLMAEQSGTIGHVFNTVGSGVKGGGTPGYVVYGATKRGLPQMTDSLVAELEKGVQVCVLPPPTPTPAVHFEGTFPLASASEAPLPQPPTTKPRPLKYQRWYTIQPPPTPTSRPITTPAQGYDKKSTAGKVNVHTLSPGMVFTQLLLDDSTPEVRWGRVCGLYFQGPGSRV